MKVKRIISVLLAAVIVAAAVGGTLNIFAKTADSSSEKNPAWLSDFYIRESSTDLGRKEMVPKADGIYTRTLGGFKAEVESLKKVCNISLDSLTAKFDEVINNLYNMISETGLLEDYAKMKEYLIKEHGIVFPEKETATTPVYTAIVYACLKHNIISPITGEPVIIPSGTTIDRAIALVVANVLGEKLPDNVTSIDDYAIETIKQMLKKNGYEVPEGYTPKEIIAQYKIMIAEQQGYKIENQDIKNYTQKDFEYLDGSYYAAIIKMNYKVSPTPEDAYVVIKSSDTDAAAALILGLMIESKGESTLADNTLQKLFDHACKLGFFNLENGFYSDVYNYDVYLKYDCKGVWLTAYSYASKLGQNELDNVKITVNGAEVINGKSYLLKITGDVTEVVVSSVYDNGKQKENASYTFMVHNGKEKLPDNANPSNPGGSDIPEFILPDVDGSGNYAPLPEEIIFSPYDTNGQSMSGGTGDDGDVKSPQVDSVKEDTAEKSSENGITLASGLIIALCTAAGVIVGSGGVIGILFIIKRKTGHIL